MTTTLSPSKQISGIASWLLISFAAAALGAIASANAGSFYRELSRPGWAPPSWVFGPVWSVLYVMMGTAAWLVWRRGGWSGQRLALSFFLLQLAANALWSWLFFAWHQGAWASGEIVLLWLLIAATLVLFWRRSPLAGALLVPYFAWVTFAAFLCFAIWRRNPELLS